MSGIINPPVAVVVAGSAQNTDENSARQESEDINARALEQAQRYGEMSEAYRNLQSEVLELRGRVEAGQADRAELTALRSELAGLRDQILALTQQQTPAGEVEEVTPEPDPIEEEEPPPPPKRGWVEFLLSI